METLLKTTYKDYEDYENVNNSKPWEIYGVGKISWEIPEDHLFFSW